MHLLPSCAQSSARIRTSDPVWAMGYMYGAANIPWFGMTRPGQGEARSRAPGANLSPLCLDAGSILFGQGLFIVGRFPSTLSPLLIGGAAASPAELQGSIGSGEATEQGAPRGFGVDMPDNERCLEGLAVTLIRHLTAGAGHEEGVVAQVTNYLTATRRGWGPRLFMQRETGDCHGHPVWMHKVWPSDAAFRVPATLPSLASISRPTCFIWHSSCAFRV